MTPDGTAGHKIKDKHIKDISGPPHKVQRASRLKTPTGAEPEVLELRCSYTPNPFISQTASSVRSSTVIFTSTSTSALSFTIPTLFHVMARLLSPIVLMWGGAAAQPHSPSRQKQWFLATVKAQALTSAVGNGRDERVSRNSGRKGGMAEEGRGNSMPQFTTSSLFFLYCHNDFRSNLNQRIAFEGACWDAAERFSGFLSKLLLLDSIKSLTEVKSLLQFMWFPSSPDTVNQKWSAVVRDYPCNRSINLSHIQLPDP